MINVNSTQSITYSVLNKLTATFASLNLVIAAIALTAIGCIAALFQCCRNGKLFRHESAGVPAANVHKPQPEIKYQNIQLAAHGVNQYQAGGPAACTPLACRFIASSLPVSPEMIERLILENNYKGDAFLETENCIAQTNLSVAENPWLSQRPFGNSMQVVLQREGENSLSAAVTSILDETGIAGAVITGNGVTIAMRKQGGNLEFFDSHGDSTITKKDNAAYVITFTNDQKKLIVDFLADRFPDIGFPPLLEIWPIQSKEL